MKLDILAAFNTNSRRLIRIWRSWGLVGSKKRKQGAAGWGWGWGKYVKFRKSTKNCETCFFTSEVPIGRTELSLSPAISKRCSLSNGHGARG